MSSDNRRRSRTKSLPPSVNEELEDNQAGFIDKIEEDDEQIHFDFESENENENVKSSKKPFTVAKQEIAHARRLSEKLSSSPLQSELPPISTAATLANSSTSSLLGSIYSIGGAVLSFIRGPVETDSNDELATSSSEYHCRNKSNSFSFSNPKMAQTTHEAEDFDSDSSDAPDFNAPSSYGQTIQFGDLDDQHELLSKQQGKLLLAEPGRGKIVFEKVGTFCNLIGREFPQDEHVLSASDISTIQSQIPARWNIYNEWILLYSTRGNGFSLTTLYHQLKSFKGPVIISIKDEYGAVFGAFLNQSFAPRQGHYGNGECFLWTIKNNSVYTKYPSTGKNNYFIITEPDYLAIGCGGGKFGLWLEKELFKGISDPVPTFDNEQLSTKQQFECIAIEIWGLDLNE